MNELELWISRDTIESPYQRLVLWLGQKPTLSHENFWCGDSVFRPNILPNNLFPELLPGECKKVRLTIME